MSSPWKLVAWQSNCITASPHRSSQLVTKNRANLLWKNIAIMFWRLALVPCLVSADARKTQEEAVEEQLLENRQLREALQDTEALNHKLLRS